MKTLLYLTFVLIGFSYKVYSQSISNLELLKNMALPDSSSYLKDSDSRFNHDKPCNILQKESNNNFLLKTKISMSWNTSISSWVDSSRYDYLYNPDNKLIELSYKAWVSTEWINSQKFLYKFNENKYLIEFLWLSWLSTYWRESEKHLYTYNQENQLIEILKQRKYLDDTTEWKNFYKENNTYDVNSNLTQVIGYEWFGGNWLEKDKYIYTYLNNNVYQLTKLYYDGYAWKNNYKYSYSFNVKNQLTEIIWFYWGGSSWQNLYKYYYTYDENSNVIELLKMIWTDQGSWRFYDRYSSIYDSYGIKTEELYQIWNTSQQWRNISKYLFSYVQMDVDYVVEYQYNLSTNYPNPFNPSTTIAYSIPHQSFVTLRVYDILGRKVATLVNEEKPTGIYEIEFSGSNLPSGVYFYQLKADKYVETKKMVLLR